MAVVARAVAAVALVLAAALLPQVGGVSKADAEAPGALLERSDSGVLDQSLVRAGVRVTSIRYRSTPSAASPTGEVTGAVYVPAGAPPAEGWPVIAYGHATTGVENRCAPSGAASMFGNLPTVSRLLAQGWAVVVSDYRGLGSPGRHPYLYAPDAARDVLDAVRAAYAAVPSLSRSVILYGVSQGGQAVQMAAELAASYAPELRIRGVALNSPSLDLTGLVEVIDRKSWPLMQTAVIAMVIRGLQAEYPQARLDDYLHGAMLRWAEGPVPCTTETAYLETVPNDRSWFAFADDRARELLRRYLSESRLPATAIPFPVFISRGTDDTLATTAWQTDAVDRMCRMGDRVRQHFRPGDHIDPIDLAPTPEWVDTYLPGDVTPTIQWIRNLLAGDPGTPTCGTS